MPEYWNWANNWINSFQSPSIPIGLISLQKYGDPFLKYQLKIETFKLDKNLRKLKYIILIVFVIILPLFLVDILGQGSPYFCKLISPIPTHSKQILIAFSNSTLVAPWLYP